MTPNQIVSHNLRRARVLRKWTQERAAAELSKYAARPISEASYAQAESAAQGRRQRRFDADELLALCRAFNLSLAYFLLPPTETVTTPREEIPAETMLNFALGLDGDTRAAIQGWLPVTSSQAMLLRKWQREHEELVGEWEAELQANVAALEALHVETEATNPKEQR